MALPLREATAKEPHDLRQCQYPPSWSGVFGPKLTNLLSALFFFPRLDPNFFPPQRMGGWKGRKKECHAQGEKAAKLTVLFINPFTWPSATATWGKTSGGHYMCTPCLVPNPKRKSLIEKEKDLAFSQEGHNAGRTSVDLEQDRDKVGRLNSPKEAQPKATLQRLESLEIYLNHAVRLCSQRSDFRTPSWLPQVTKEALVSLVKWVQI